jgi:hypothetical protein
MFRYNDDIGLFTLDRGPDTCKHATEFCSKHCYNRKLYVVFKQMCGRDIKNNKFWLESSGKDIVKILKRKRKPINRIRLCSRGEPFADISDITKLEDWLTELEKESIDVMIPTRAWRDVKLKKIIEQKLFKFHNAKILASLDPVTLSSYDILVKEGWSTTFFGDDNMNKPNFFKCPKTWKKQKKVCLHCQNGCYSNKRVDIHFKEH